MPGMTKKLEDAITKLRNATAYESSLHAARQAIFLKPFLNTLMSEVCRVLAT
jgi:hypothetical protein